MPGKTVTLDRKVPEFTLPATGGKAWKLSGAAGRKLMLIGDGRHQMLWKIAGNTANPASSAIWRIECLKNGVAEPTQTIESVNLMAGRPGTTGLLNIPANCPIAVITMNISGGSGSDPSTISVGSLSMRRISN